MPKYIEVGQDVIEFPDNMSDSDIETVLSAQFGGTKKEEPKPAPAQRTSSVWEEAGRQLGLTARAGLTGLTSLPAMLAEPIVYGVNKIAGRQVLPSQQAAVQNLLTQMGLPEPQGRLERAVQAGTAAMADVGGQARLAAKAGTEMLRPLTQALPQQIASAGAAGTAAQATAERAQEVGYSPLQTAAATLAVGTLAGLTGAKAARVAQKEPIVPVSMDEVKLDAQRAYTRVDNAGINVKPKPVLDTLDNIEANLVNNSNFNPLLDSHKPVKTVLDQMRQMVGTTRVSFAKMDQLRQAANDLARESKDPATRRLASQVVAGIDDKITSLQPTDLITGKNSIASALDDIKEARDSWRKVSKAGLLEDALNVAEARALDPKTSEGELIRNQFKLLAANKNKMRLFTKDEQEAIRRIVSGQGIEKLLSLTARFNPERSQLVAGSQLAMGAAMSPGAALATAGIGFASDKALARIQRQAAQDVISQILSGNIAPPPSKAAWRSLIEARMREVSTEPVQTEE